MNQGIMTALDRWVVYPQICDIHTMVTSNTKQFFRENSGNNTVNCFK